MEELLVLLGLMTPLIAATTGFAAAWWTTTRQVRRLERVLTHFAGADERVEAVERAIEAVHEQLDRLREDHQFFSRVLADRVAPAPPPMPPNGPRISTPH